ncbi:MAG: methylmalonyl-CoA mutase, partial [Acidimicrobiia bacterium]|nr:methylmalonyl-CoA mutase [Acidimicrobiia bacterium]
TVDDDPDPDVFPSDPLLERGQRERLAALRAERDQAEVDAGLDDLRAAARGSDNVLYPMKDALRARATLGEVSDALREVFGTHTP